MPASEALFQSVDFIEQIKSGLAKPTSMLDFEVAEYSNGTFSFILPIKFAQQQITTQPKPSASSKPPAASTTQSVAAPPASASSAQTNSTTQTSSSTSSQSKSPTKANRS